MLTDLVMPQMGGVELVKGLIQFQSGIKSIYMSGYSDAAKSQGNLLDPGAPFLQKPFSSASLLKMLHDVLHPES